MNRENKRLPHIWKHRGWWYASEDKQHYRDGRVISGFAEFGALAAKLRGGDEAVIEWAKQNPRR